MTKGGQRIRWLLAYCAVLLLPLAALTACSGSNTREARISVSKQFRVFSLDTTGLPWLLAQRLGPPPFEADWSQAREVRGGLWALPARERVCLIQQQPKGAIGIACTPIRQVLSHGIFIASLKDPSMREPGLQREIFGLVPDGVHGVRVITPDHRAVTATVTRNLFVQRDNIPAAPQTLTLIRD